MAEKDRTLKDIFSVALDDVTGRVCIIRCNREIIGALSREESLAFANDINSWVPQSMRPAPAQGIVLDG